MGPQTLITQAQKFPETPPPPGNCNEGEPPAGPKRRRNEVDLVQDVESARPTRNQGKRPVEYSEAKRRATRQCTRRIGYMDRGQQGNNRRAKRGHAATVVGTAVLERVVQGRYKWRDGM